MTAEGGPQPAGPQPAGQGPVFVAEHEPEVAEMTRRYLERAAIRVRVTGTARETLAMLSDPSAALFVVDLTMPGLDVRRVRRALAPGVGGVRGGRPSPGGPGGGVPPVKGSQQSTQVPVVFLVDSHGVRPRGLSGAAARERRWISRPFSPRTLVTAVTELLRPASVPLPVPASPPATPGDALALDATHRTATIAGQTVPLTRTEFALIAAMAGRAGRVLSRSDLLSALEGERGKSPAARAVDVYVTQLRAKLPGVTIRTVRGVGYVLEAASRTGFHDRG